MWAQQPVFALVFVASFMIADVRGFGTRVTLLQFGCSFAYCSPQGPPMQHNTPHVHCSTSPSWHRSVTTCMVEQGRATSLLQTKLRVYCMPNQGKKNSPKRSTVKVAFRPTLTIMPSVNTQAPLRRPLRPFLIHAQQQVSRSVNMAHASSQSQTLDSTLTALVSRGKRWPPAWRGFCFESVHSPASR
jgi:hypothetical protein